MNKAYKQEWVTEVADQLISEGFRVFIAESGTHAFFTDKEGSNVVSFEPNIGGMSYCKCHVSPPGSGCGSGWGIPNDGQYSHRQMLYASTPQWANPDVVTLKPRTMEKFLDTYKASKYTEYTPERLPESV